MESTLSILAMLVFVGAISTFVLVSKYARNLFSLYQSHVIQGVENKLRLSFISTSPRFLLLSSLLLTLLLTFSGFVLLGPVGLLLGVIIGLSAPWIYQYFYRRQRRKKFVYQLPDALASLAASMRAGGSLSKGIEMLAQRQPAPLGQEFALVVAEARVGQELETSLKALGQRLDCSELELMTTAIVIARGVGGNLAETLDSLAETLREKAQVEGKILALTAMGRAQGWVVSLLPIGVGIALYMIEPDKMSLLVTETWGWVVLAIMTVMMALAVWMIYRIVNIDV